MWNGKRVSIDSQFSQVCTDTYDGGDPSYEVSTLITFFALILPSCAEKSMPKKCRYEWLLWYGKYTYNICVHICDDDFITQRNNSKMIAVFWYIFLRVKLIKL